MLWSKKQVFISMPALEFRSLFEYPNRCDGMSRCRWASTELSVDKGTLLFL